MTLWRWQTKKKTIRDKVLKENKKKRIAIDCKKTENIVVNRRNDQDANYELEISTSSEYMSLNISELC